MNSKPYYLPEKEWPEYLNGHKELCDIYIGGCCCNRKYDYNDLKEFAHAHPKRAWYDLTGGVICLPKRSMLDYKSTMIHELAHLKRGPNEHHSKAWAKCVLDLGGTLEPEYIDGSWSQGYSLSDNFEIDRRIMKQHYEALAKRDVERWMKQWEKRHKAVLNT